MAMNRVMTYNCRMTTLTKILDKEALFSALAYEVEDWDHDWLPLRDAVLTEKGVERNQQTISLIAQFLLDYPEYGQNDRIVDKIRSLYQCFDTSQLNREPIEACPSSGNDSISLVGGNKRSIAYAMKVIEGSLDYSPVTVFWHPTHTRDDLNNQKGQPTTDTPVVCTSS